VGKRVAALVLAAALSIACGGREAANNGRGPTDETGLDAAVSAVFDASVAPPYADGATPIDPDGTLMSDGAVPPSADGGVVSPVEGATESDMDGDSPDSDPSAFSTGVASCPPDTADASDVVVGACSPLPSYIVLPPTYQGIGDLPPMPVGSWVGCQYIACSPDHRCTSCKCIDGDGGAVWTCY
jgi:hypothetical protein